MKNLNLAYYDEPFQDTPFFLIAKKLTLHPLLSRREFIFQYELLRRSAAQFFAGLIHLSDSHYRTAFIRPIILDGQTLPDKEMEETIKAALIEQIIDIDTVRFEIHELII